MSLQTVLLKVLKMVRQSRMRVQPGLLQVILAMKIWKPFSAIFAVVVFAGIYTTAVPLLYNPASRFAKEGTSQFKILTVVLAVVGLVVGLFLPFKVLVNYIYVLNGYVGAVLIIFMIWKNIKDTFLKKKNA